MSGLKGREILLGVTGGIAVYKAVEVLRRLKQAGAEVTVVMTAHAREFVQPLTFQTLSHRPVGLELFDLDQENRIGHIRMAERAELVLVAPCTANFIAKLRTGLADDLLSTLLLATPAPVMLAPAMNDGMLAHPATQENLRVLESRGVKIIPPEVGELAEGKIALGRLAEPERVVAAVAAHFNTGPGGVAHSPTLPLASRNGLTGRKVLITAGPTVERIDPVRYITNRSSGRMGYALAEACRNAGAEVILVSGPTHLPQPQGMTVLSVGSGAEMHAAVLEHEPRQDALIFAAAVSDYRAETPLTHKIKRGSQSTLTLNLTQNPDIAADAGKRKRPGQVLVVFAAESQDLVANAQGKLERKNADLVVANDITEPGSGFDSTHNRVVLIRRAAPGQAAPTPLRLPLLDKREVARHIASAVAELLSLRG
ncbi:MAG: bifunctional phosphopantothenoylcysteine decarboxylase/phosphopantothenate--cysteine ligase CoaBC [Deltaproteobacteria bacterium]|nr:bifunctional phosphopantothenoylcysteine decarboxylase/phosphopantothenate--cysteine ligase CoaBC [Deltaproteobacteria bacterium]